MHGTPRRRYRVRFERLDSLLVAQGYDTEQEKAAFLGLQQSTLLRVRRGDVEPSTKFLGAVQDRFPALAFEDLFERVGDGTGPKPAGPKPAGPKPAGPKTPRPPKKPTKVSAA